MDKSPQCDPEKSNIKDQIKTEMDKSPQYDHENSRDGMYSNISSDSGVESVSTSSFCATDCIITESMLAEEAALEKKVVLEEEALKKKKIEEGKKNLEEQSYKRLHLLLSRSSTYADFMAEKLQKHESLEKQMKRKSSASPAKKQKNETGILNIYKNETMRSKLMDDIKSQHDSQDSENAAVEQPKLLTGGTMKPYQLEGYEWLKALFENGVNGILADEMGLGKTIQCIAVIAYLIEMEVAGPFFVCGPLSTLPNWYAEFKRFTPDIPILLFHGSKPDRKALREKIFKKVKVKDSYIYPVVITSYQIALMDASFLSKIEWKMLVIDEAHRIKNFQCKLILALKKFNTIYRLLLTGTPLQNNLTELWSLLNFILPEVFDDLQAFEAWFDISSLTERGATEEILAQEQEKQIVTLIHQILTPFLLRRTKADVEFDLPPKKELIIHAPFSELQEQYYTAVLNGTIYELLGVEQGRSEIPVHTKRVSKRTDYFGCEDPDMDNIMEIARSSIKEENDVSENGWKLSEPSLEDDSKLGITPVKSENLENTPVKSEIRLSYKNYFMMLRKICNHPYLISYPIDPRTEDYLVDENLVKHSGKLQILDILLPELKKRGHKVLLFSQFVSMLRILQDYCYYRGYKYTKLDGSMDLSSREEEMNDFRNDDDIFIFLISTKAGGLGINLTAADTVILYDSDWNPQGDLQAQDRCHRIGQTKPVLVYRLVVPKTVDEKIIIRAVAKRKLEKAIIYNKRFRSKKEFSTSGISRQELLELLESSDFNRLVKAEEVILSKKELERLLDRSDLV